MIRVLELFAGSRSIGKQADALGCKVFSVDKFIEENMDFVGGIEELTREMIVESMGGEPQMVWASPVCSVWSKMGWFSHWDKDIYRIAHAFIAKTDFANESVAMVKKTIEIFSWFPNAIFFMENPEGMLQKHPVIAYFKVFGLGMRKTLVTYCQYGLDVRKPTHIWNNCTTWKPKPICDNGGDCHIRSPRDEQAGLLGKAGNYERSIIPEELCREIVEAAILQIMDAPNEKSSTLQKELF